MNIYKQFGVDPDHYKDIIYQTSSDPISISPNVDAACGGGILPGSIVVVTGPEKLGKTTLALQLIDSALKADKNAEADYIDVENRLQLRDIQGVGNLAALLKKKRFKVIGPTDKQDLSAEKVFQLMEAITAIKKNSIIVLDSLGMLATRSDLDYDFGEKALRPGVPKMTSIFCKKMMQKLRYTGNIIYLITHQHENMNARSPYAKQKKEDGGTKIKYAANYKFELTHKRDLFDQKSKIGHTVYFRCLHSPIEAPVTEGEETFFYHVFGTGIDKIRESIELASKIGIIERRGSWFSYNDIKAQGLTNISDMFKADDGLYKQLSKDIKEALYAV